MAELNENVGRILIVATVLFLFGLMLSILGMLGVVSSRVSIVGSILIFAALALRIISTLKK